MFDIDVGYLVIFTRCWLILVLAWLHGQQHPPLMAHHPLQWWDNHSHWRSTTILPSLALGMLWDILHLIQLNAAAVYICKPLNSRQHRIHILQNNFCQYLLTPLSSNIEDIIVGWYRNLLSTRIEKSSLGGLRPSYILYLKNNPHLTIPPSPLLLLIGYPSQWLCTVGLGYTHTRTQKTQENTPGSCKPNEPVCKLNPIALKPVW